MRLCCGSQESNTEPGSIKPSHECAGKREACGISIAAEQRSKILEGDLEQHEKGNHGESGPGEFVAWQLCGGHCTCEGTQRGRNDGGRATAPVDRGVSGWLALVRLSIVHSTSDERSYSVSRDQKSTRLNSS